MACVDLPAFPLQLLLRQHPSWRGLPAAVVDRDKPQGVLQWVNEAARARRILPGMRYAASLGLCPHLRAGTVDEQIVRDEVRQLVKQLGSASPKVQSETEEPGVFWLDVAGFELLYPCLRQWAELLSRQLDQQGLESSIAVGFTRFGTYAAARSGQGIRVFDHAQQEQEHLRKVPIERLGLAPPMRDKLHRLGVHTLGQFAQLPGAGIRRRFGVEAQKLHQLAKGQGWAPLSPDLVIEPVLRSHLYDLPEVDAERLLQQLHSFLPGMLAELAKRSELLASLELLLLLDDGTRCHEHLRPAEPTRDQDQLMGLLSLRLRRLELSAGVNELELRANGAAISWQQTSLFAQAPRRDLAAAQRALARLRAELGNDAVQYAHLSEGHLPEASYGWQICSQLQAAQAKEASPLPLIRRLYTPARVLPARPRHEPDGWLILGPADGPVEEIRGPYLLSGGWWMRETARTYSYIRTRNGRWLWVYLDRRRRRWMLQGEVA